MWPNKKASIGVILLMAGLLIAAICWQQKNERERAARQAETLIKPTWQDSPLDFEDSKKAIRDFEINYGKIGVLVETWFYAWQAMGSLEKSEILVATLMIITGIGFLIAAKRGG